MQALQGLPMRLVLPQASKPVLEGGYSWFGGHDRHGEQLRAYPVWGLDLGLADCPGWLLTCSMFVPLCRDSARGVERLAKHLVATRSTLGRPHVLGFSQGGILAFLLATRGRFCLAFPLAGVPSRWAVQHWPRRGCATAVFAQHGRDDAVLPLRRTEVRLHAIRRRQRRRRLLRPPPLETTSAAATRGSCALSLLVYKGGHALHPEWFAQVRRVLATSVGRDQQGCTAAAALNMSFCDNGPPALLSAIAYGPRKWQCRSRYQRQRVPS